LSSSDVGALQSTADESAPVRSRSVNLPRLQDFNVTTIDGEVMALSGVGFYVEVFGFGKQARVCFDGKPVVELQSMDEALRVLRSANEQSRRTDTAEESAKTQ